jgi:rhodanese-related sulfurtransferase
MSMIGNQNSERGEIARRMATVAGLAVIVGLAFNSVNPLGVRGAINTAAKSIPGSAGPTAANATTVPKSFYENETVSLSLETEAAPIPSIAAANPAPTVPILTWPETSKLLAAGQIVLVDARAAAYYETEHVPGAVSLPASSSAADLSAFSAKYPKGTALVVYCGSVKCPLSHQLVAVLTQQLGYTNVREMPGGFAEYRQFQTQLAKGSAQ